MSNNNEWKYLRAIQEHKYIRRDTLYVKNIPEELKLKFKEWCVVHQITMSAKIEELMLQVVEEY